MTAFRFEATILGSPELLEVQVIPSVEVWMVPEPPTPTNNTVVLSVLVVLDELLDEVQDMEMKLKRNRERMMSICLTWFPIGGLGEPKLYQNMWCFTIMWGIILGGCLTVKN